jgi:hypothetical protein
LQIFEERTSRASALDVERWTFASEFSATNMSDSLNTTESPAREKLTKKAITADQAIVEVLVPSTC